MAIYTVTLRADKARWPVLLSNGNLVDSGDAGRRPPLRHLARPAPKPSYLFALVAGKLVARESASPRARHRAPAAGLRAPGRPGQDRARPALADPRRASWDEARFGLPLDLERFMVVATSDFNMGAMETRA